MMHMVICITCIRKYPLISAGNLEFKRGVSFSRIIDHSYESLIIPLLAIMNDSIEVHTLTCTHLQAASRHT